MRFRREYNGGLLVDELTIKSSGDDIYFECHELPTKLGGASKTCVSLEREEALKAYHELGRILGIKPNE